MCRDNASPTHLDTDGKQFFGKTLSGWEEIRNALCCVEKFWNNGNQHVRVEVIERNKESNLQVIFRSVLELDEFMKSRIRQRLLELVGDSLELDEFERVTNEISHSFDEAQEVYGKVRLD